MKEFDQLPKSIKKAVRYINQDAPEEKLIYIKNVFDNAIEKRLSQNNKSSDFVNK